MKEQNEAPQQQGIEPDSNEAAEAPAKQGAAEAKAEAKLVIKAGDRGLILSTIEDMYRFAKYLIASGMAPPHIKTPEQAVICMQMGAEVGLRPMGSIQAVTVIKGKASLFGDALLAVCRTSAHWDESGFKEWMTGTPGDSDWTAHCQCRRRGGNDIVEGFCVGDAKRAGLWGGAGPWTSYPKRMLKWRARGFALRDGFADALSGFISQEEASDYPVPLQGAQRPEPEAAAPDRSATARVKKRIASRSSNTSDLTKREETAFAKEDKEDLAAAKKADELPAEQPSVQPSAPDPPPPGQLLSRYLSLPKQVRKVVLLKHKINKMEPHARWADAKVVSAVNSTLDDILNAGDESQPDSGTAVDAEYTVTDKE